MIVLEHIPREPETATLWLPRVWYPETSVRASPETLEISPFLALKENVDGSALRIGKTKWFLESRT